MLAKRILEDFKKTLEMSRRILQRGREYLEAQEQGREYQEANVETLIEEDEKTLVL